jgi:hypothetical protein
MYKKLTLETDVVSSVHNYRGECHEMPKRLYTVRKQVRRRKKKGEPTDFQVPCVKS